MDRLLAAVKDFLRPEVIWGLVGIILLLLELAMPGLIIFFFGIGACIVALVCLLIDIPLNLQLLIFIVCSVVSLLALRKWLRGMFLGHVTSKQDLKQNLSEFIGERAVVTSTIIPKSGGRVELHGTTWQAQAEEEIPESAVMKITGKTNITLTVEPL